MIVGPHRQRWEAQVGDELQVQTKALTQSYLKRREPLVELALLLGVIILVVPRLLLPPQSPQLTPMVPEFGLVALRMSVIHHILAHRSAVISRAQYDQLTSGMNLLAVESIVGIGTEVRTQQFPNGAIAITYEWVNLDGSRMIATFQDMKLTGKAQAGLK